MKNVATNDVKACFGFDLGDTSSHYCLVSENGEVELRGKLPNLRTAFEDVLSRCPDARIVLEASTGSHWISAFMRCLGREVYVVNPRHLPMITESSRKSDRNDAEELAHLGRRDVKRLRVVQPKSDQCMRARVLLRVRHQLVANRTRAVNLTRSSLKVFGYHGPTCSSEAFTTRIADLIPDDLAPLLAPLLNMLRALNREIERCDRRLAEIRRKQFAGCGVLQQIHGVGPLVALAFVTSIGDPKRFRHSRTVGAYFGLTPQSRQSGRSNPRLPITKEGDRIVRTLLVTAATHILRQSAPDTALKRHGRRLAKSGSPRDKARARIAVARKLAVVMHRLWLTGEVYRPLPQLAVGA